MLQLRDVAQRTPVNIDFNVAFARDTHLAIGDLNHRELSEHVDSRAEVSKRGAWNR